MHTEVSKFPSALWRTIETLFPNDLETIQQGFSAKRNGSFRINTLRHPLVESFVLPEKVEKEFQEKNIAIKKTNFPLVWTFAPESLFSIKGSRAFYEGDIYLQSISSLLPVMEFDFSTTKNPTVLDVCAAPGSKTSQMASILQNRGSIVALEKNQIRYEKLLHTLKTQGVTNTTAIKADALKYLEHNKRFFSHILLDAPCSAEGRMHFENEKSFGFWSEKKVQQNATLQKALLTASLHHLAPNGELIYSTCTLSAEENEEVLKEVLKDFPTVSLIPMNHIQIPESKQGFGAYPLAMRVIPSQNTEGFFIAKMKKSP